MEGRIAVSGARGRLGSALVAELRRTGAEVVAWSRPDYDLDDPGSADRLVGRDRPALVYHAAAWTDVDGCAREPELAMRRNGLATTEMARACVDAAIDLVYVSTNEVFNGERLDGQGYDERDEPQPPNEYGLTKRAGEIGVENAFRESGGVAWIARTSWLFGPPGNDFPARITAAADRLDPGQPLRVVADEVARPTYAPDLAAALVALTEVAPAGTYHLANEGPASRYEWAQQVLRRCRPAVELEPIKLADYPRASTPPRWGVLDTSAATRLGVSMRPWPEPLDDYLGRLCP